MRKYFLVIVIVMNISDLFAGVGDPLSSFLKSDFCTFFNINEISRRNIDTNRTDINFKTGGFQEYIDLVISIDKNDIIKWSELIIKREWISKQQHFANDLIKSYLVEMASRKSKEFISPLSKLIWDGSGKKNNQLIVAYEAIQGNKTSVLIKSDDCKFSFLNNTFNDQNKDQLVISVSLIDQLKWKLLTPPSDIFIDSTFMTNYGLKMVQDEKDMKIWIDHDVSTNIFRVVDIRWVLKDENVAKSYHEANLLENSENGEAVNESSISSFANDLYVFKQNPEMDVMMKNLEIDQNSYFFIFRVKNVLAKVFVAGSKKLSINEAAVFGKKAAEKIEGGK